MIRLYLMPITGTGVYPDSRRPKYTESILTPHGVQWSMMDYGNRPVCLLGGDTDAATHTELIAQADVQAFPDNFQSSSLTVGGQLANVRQRFEDFTIPGTWIQAADTYLQVARSVACIFQLLQRLNRIMGNVDPFAGVTLNTQFQDCPADFRAAMIEAAASFNWSTTGLSGTTTLRVALKYFSDQWGSTPLRLGGMIF